MIYVAYHQQDEVTGGLVTAAFARSFLTANVASIQYDQLPELLLKDSPLFLVLIHPDDAIASLLAELETHLSKAKIIIFGRLSPYIAGYLNVMTEEVPESWVPLADAHPAKSFQMSESQLQIKYTDFLGDLSVPIQSRPFLRYDFTNEWNNLGYGRVMADGSRWSLSQVAEVSAGNVLANVIADNKILSAYAAHWEKSDALILWFNREVGVIDSQEWRLIEYFFASYRHNVYPCMPCVSEIPAGYDMAVTMRLDCDEDIESSRALFHCYQAMNVPFSLAIHTKVLADSSHEQMMLDVFSAKGAILSHSATHPVNWGGSYDAALIEAETSLSVIQRIVGKNHVRYAVSPFHQTPLYALQALARAGFHGCIGGIVSSDPEFLIARGGELYDCPAQFVGHSQSCMLHGDCLLEDGDPLFVYKQAVDVAKASRSLFGFLDHPFSPRYTYGWKSEEDRTKAHEALIRYIREQGNILFFNENDALDFIRDKASISLSLDENRNVQCQLPASIQYDVVVEYQGELIKISRISG